MIFNYTWFLTSVYQITDVQKVENILSSLLARILSKCCKFQITLQTNTTQQQILHTKILWTFHLLEIPNAKKVTSKRLALSVYLNKKIQLTNTQNSHTLKLFVNLNFLLI